MFWNRIRLLRAPEGAAGGNGVATVEPVIPPAMPLVGGTSNTPPPAEKQDAGNGGEQEKLPEGMKRGHDGKIQVLTQSAYKRMKDEARERGRREAAESLARDLGFDSVEEMREAALRAKANGNGKRNGKREEDLEEEIEAKPDDKEKAKPEKPEDKRDNGRDSRRWESKLAAAQQEREVLNRRLAAEVKLRKDLQRELDAKDAEMSLREAAVAAGVKDVDYAVRLLTRKLDGQDEAALKDFDESKFFTGLKDSHPYLFGEMIRPATTGTGVGTAPSAPKPGAAAQDQAKSGAVDVRKMSKEEFNAHLAKRGLSTGM